MSDKLKSILLKYGITTAIAGAMTYSILWLHNFSETKELLDKYRILCDAFTVPGVVLMLVAVLVWISNQGTFDGLSWSLKSAVRALIPFGRTREKHESYRDYVERRREKGGVRGYGFIAIVGAVFFAVALIFDALFYSIS